MAQSLYLTWPAFSDRTSAAPVAQSTQVSRQKQSRRAGGDTASLGIRKAWGVRSRFWGAAAAAGSGRRRGVVPVLTGSRAPAPPGCSREVPAAAAHCSPPCGWHFPVRQRGATFNFCTNWSVTRWESPLEHSDIPDEYFPNEGPQGVRTRPADRDLASG